MNKPPEHNAAVYYIKRRIDVRIIAQEYCWVFFFLSRRYRDISREGLGSLFRPTPGSGEGTGS